MNCGIIYEYLSIDFFKAVAVCYSSYRLTGKKERARGRDRERDRKRVSKRERMEEKEGES